MQENLDSTVDRDPLPIGEPVDSRPAKLPRRVLLEGRRVTVMPLQPRIHGDDLYESSHGPEKERLWLYLSKGPFPERATFDEYLLQSAASQDPLFFSILDNGSRKALGYAAYLRAEPIHRTIEIGHILYTPALQKTAGATEAMYLMARHVFEDLSYRRYEWKCNVLNTASRKAALRLGFTFEGVFRQHMIYKGCSRDSAWFSMLDREWPERRRMFEQWLDPQNFDDRGRQRRRLTEFSGTGMAKG